MVIKDTRSEREKMIAEEPYNVQDPELVADRIRAQQLFKKLNTTTLTDLESNARIAKELFGSTGEKIEVRPDFSCDYGYNIHVGENFFANWNCILLDTCPINIGKNALLAPRVQMYSASHPFDIERRTHWIGTGASINIGDNCWIGGGAIITPGVTLGNNVIVGAGSVVTKSFGDNLVIAGNPARVIRELDPNEIRQ
ncbi:sugar O-acetyltransferase [Lentilactobacillus senioris]|uniref:sugar O-acetyltransferase n=1 Tax=Lentilactobacillus senioris TaxID=931534 RepID=UPI003D294460